MEECCLKRLEFTWVWYSDESYMSWKFCKTVGWLKFMMLLLIILDVIFLRVIPWLRCFFLRVFFSASSISKKTGLVAR